MEADRHRFHRLTVCILAVTLLVTVGCRLLFLGGVVGATVGTVAYIDGKLEDTLGNPYEHVVTATEKAITQLGFAQPEERKDSLSATFVTHSARGDRVEISLTNISDSATKVSIRINTFGDQEISMTILDKIKTNLQ